MSTEIATLEQVHEIEPELAQYVKPELLSGETMNIGLFVMNILKAKADNKGSEALRSMGFVSSANVKLDELVKKFHGDETESMYREKYFDKYPNCIFLPKGAADYLVDKFGMRVDIAQNYRGAVPEGVAQLLSNFKLDDEDAAGHYDYWFSYFLGRPPSPDEPQTVHDARVYVNKVFGENVAAMLEDNHKNIGIFLYAKDGMLGKSATESGIARAFAMAVQSIRIDKAFARELARHVASDSFDEVDAFIKGNALFREEDKSTIAAQRRDMKAMQSGYFVLAPKESFLPDAPFETRMHLNTQHINSVLTGDRQRREQEEAARLERIARDPVVMRIVKGGYLCIAAWADEAKQIHDICEELRLV